MIHMVKELTYIRAPNKASPVTPQELFGPVNSSDQSFLLATRPDVKDERLIIYCNQVFINQTMYHPVSKIGDTNLTTLIVCHDKTTVTAMSILISNKLSVEELQVLLEVIAPGIQSFGTTFATLKQQPAFPNIFSTYIYAHRRTAYTLTFL